MKRVDDIHTTELIKLICKRRIPKVSFEYLESGTENESAIKRNKSQDDSTSIK